MPKRKSKSEKDDKTSMGGFPFAPSFLNQLRGDESKPFRPQSDAIAMDSVSLLANESTRRNVSSETPSVDTSINSEEKSQPKILSQLPSSSTLMQSSCRNAETEIVISLPSNGTFSSINKCPGNVAAVFLSPESAGSSSKLLLRGEKGAIRYVAGAAALTLLRGEASINGYTLRIGERIKVIHPPWMPAARLHFGATGKKTQGTIKSIFVKSGVVRPSEEKLPKSISSLISVVESIVMLEGIANEKQPWLLAAEETNRYESHHINNFNADCFSFLRQPIDADQQQYQHEKDLYSDSDAPICFDDEGVLILGFSTGAVCGCAGLVRRLSIDPSLIPPLWVKATEQVSRHMLNLKTASMSTSCDGIGSLEMSSNHPLPSRDPTVRPHSKVVICGAKGVGKSTCLRYCINRLLSKTRAVCVIDCDVGQPEFTIPGIVSLHVITEPVLSPAHLHLLQPERAHFVGDIVAKNDPQALTKALHSLMQCYAQLLQQQKANTKDSQRSSGGNSFALLADENDDTSAELPEPLPLLVNTDGNVRYMGAEILSAVLHIVQPTHIFHISTEKDRELPAVKDHLASSQQAEQSLEKSHEKSHEKNFPSGIPQSACELCTLEPGRLMASKVHSIDLRNLRMVAYFLSDNQQLKQKLISLSSRKVASCVSSSGSPSEPSSSSSFSSNPLYLRNGTLVDPGGAVALATMSASPLIVPFRSVALQLLDGGIPPRMYLAALNASLVAITVVGCDVQTVRMNLGSTVPCEGACPPSLRETPPRYRSVRLRFHRTAQSFSGGAMAAYGDSMSAAGDSGADTDIGALRDVVEEEEDDDDVSAEINNDSCKSERDFTMDRDEPEAMSSSSQFVECTILVCEEEDAAFSEQTYPSSSSAPLSQCIGAGIIRAIDVEKEIFYVITPVDPALLRACMRAGGTICLVRGQVQLPTCMLYAPGLPVNPYMSHEVTGEGAAVMKSRSNVKRRKSRHAKE